MYIYFFFLVINLPNSVYCPNKCGSRYPGVKIKGNLNNHFRHECGAKESSRVLIV